MNIMTKRGGLDNIATFEHVCDRKADLDNIPKNQITLGSLAIVLKGANAGLEVYMANSKKEWILLMGSSGSGGGSGGIDLSQDTVDVLHLVEGYTAHDSTGAPIVGQVPIRTIDDLIQSGDIITMPGGYYAAATEIKMPPTEYKNLNLIHYDGTLLHTYTTEEALALTELPSPPGGTDWNWNIVDIQTYLQRYPLDEIMIGAYRGGTVGFGSVAELDIEISDSRYVSPVLNFQLESHQNVIEINWGDGQIEYTPSTGSDSKQYYSFQHTYDISKKRCFTIVLFVPQPNTSQPTVKFYGTGNGRSRILSDYFETDTGDLTAADRTYLSYLTGVRLYNVKLSSNSFGWCYNLKKCSISPETVFSDASTLFKGCFKLKTLVLPSGFDLDPNTTSIPFSESNFEIISCDSDFHNIPIRAFENNTNLKYLTLAPYLYTINTGAFSGCSSLKHLTISDLTLNTTNSMDIRTDGLFAGCTSLLTVSLPNMYVAYENIYDLVTHQSIYTFDDTAISTVIVPEGISQIGENFVNSKNLQTLVLPSTLTDINGKGFYNSVMGGQQPNIYLKWTSPPNATESVVHKWNSSRVTFYVPYSQDHSVLEAYKTATNWAVCAHRMFEYKTTIDFTIDGYTYHAFPITTWLDWSYTTIYNPQNEHYVNIDYTTNGLLAPNQETPFCELVDDKLIPVFITDSPKDGAVYVTPQGGN